MLAHQRAKSEDFHPRIIKNRAKVLESLFADSQLNIRGGVSLGGLGCKSYSVIAADVNYVLLSEMKPRPKAEVPATSKLSFFVTFSCYPKVCMKLRNHFEHYLQMLPPQLFTVLSLTVASIGKVSKVFVLKTKIKSGSRLQI